MIPSHIRRASLLGLALLLFASCATQTSVLRAPTPKPLTDFVAAFNAHDVDAMLAHVTDDIGWYSVDGATVGVEAEGKDALRTAMRDYFASQPTVRSELVHALPDGRFVAVRERVRWTDARGAHAQEALAVYEVEGERIRRVWYFPAEKATPRTSE